MLHVLRYVFKSGECIGFQQLLILKQTILQNSETYMRNLCSVTEEYQLTSEKSQCRVHL